MKKLMFCLITVTTFFAAQAQNADSLAYQLQRKKINGLLARREQKFSQYSASLNAKTGIFGWQTKKDIRRSGDILMDIAKTDEVIFKEIKILLDFKTYQNTQVVAKLAQSHESESQVVNYMATINKLREQNELIKAEQAKQADEYHQKLTMHIIIILALIVVSLFLFFRGKAQNKA